MGFFGIPTTKPKAQSARSRTDAGGKRAVIPIRQLGRTTYRASCAQCPLDKDTRDLKHPKMEPTGSSSPLIYMLGETPSRADDDEGDHFRGNGCDVVRNALPLNIDKQTRWSTTVQCRPPGNRTPTEVEIVCCSSRVEQDIEATQPLIVVGFGDVPLRWAIDVNKISDWRGDLIPIRVGNWDCWYAPMYDPGWVDYWKRKGKTEYQHTFKRDLARVIALASGEKELAEPWIPGGPGDEEALGAGMHWELSWKVDAVAEFLEHMRSQGDQSVDIETNGLRPYKKDSKILSIAFGTWDVSYAIPIAHRESKWTPQQLKQVWQLVGEHLRHTEIKFWAHHLKFETEWLSMPFALGRSILFEVNWQDTMAQAHVMSSKKLSGLSLDSRCKALFGIPEKQLDDMDRANLDAAPLVKVLRYNARDTKFTDMVRRLQEPLIEAEGLQCAYDLMVGRVPALTIAQQMGVVPDTAFAERKHAELQTEIIQLEEQIQALPDVKALAEEQREPFNSASGPQLQVLLRDKLKLKEGWRMVDGMHKYSTDEDVLKAIAHPIGQLILEKRGLDKLDGTYVLGLCKKGADPRSGKLIWEDGLVHTIYNYLLTTTGRLSSEDPNLQNFPKRKHKEIREAIMAAFGCVMASIDYGQIEARVIAMASQCPVFSKALWDNYDIHMAWAKIIAAAYPEVMVKYMKEAKKDEAKAMKLFRSDIKNQWTFPLFFGSDLAPIAHTLGVEQRRLEKQHKAFWEMFEAVKKWQHRVLANYKKNGYVETLTGRRRYEPLSENEAINSGIQGTASDIVVDGMKRLAEEAYERDRWSLAARMNIHDDLTFYLPENAIEEDLSIIVPIMCTPDFDFVNVPITVEISIGSNWGNQEDLVTVESTEYGYPKT